MNKVNLIIKRLRLEKNLNQEQLAEQLHVTDKAVSKWERGINFPDLGLMESLAAALDTTPAKLLGLEQADQEEILKTLTQVHEEQLTDAHKHLRFSGWAAIGLCILLWGRFLLDDMYALLCWLIPALAIGALYLLFRYGAIKPWSGPEILIFYGSLFPLGICMMGYWVTDHGFSDWVNIPCILIAAGFGQWLFYRTMNPHWAKALPIIGLAAYILWHLSTGHFSFLTLGCLAVCFALWLVLRRFDKQRKPIPILKFTAACAVGLTLFVLLNYSAMVRAYIHLQQDHLTQYCEELLDSGESYTTYGPWRVYISPEEEIVEFHTGGSGIGSETSYEGFYYSARDEHFPVMGVGQSVDVYEPTGTGYWTDGTDNHGTSQRIHKYFYWFEAFF